MSWASTMTDFWWCVNMLPLVNFCAVLSTVPPSLGTMAATTFVFAKKSRVSCRRHSSPLDSCCYEHCWVR